MNFFYTRVALPEYTHMHAHLHTISLRKNLGHGTCEFIPGTRDFLVIYYSCCHINDTVRISVTRLMNERDKRRSCRRSAPLADWQTCEKTVICYLYRCKRASFNFFLLPIVRVFFEHLWSSLTSSRELLHDAIFF